MFDAFLSQHKTSLLGLFVVLCILLAVYLRLDFYPNTYYGDEEIPIALITHMEKNHSLDTNWSRGIWRNPQDRWAYSYDQYNFSSYNSTQYYLNQLFQVTKNNTNPAIFNRVCSVVFQALSLIIIFYAIHHLIGVFGAITATLFFVFNPLFVVDAHYARPESFLIFITTLAIIFHLLADKKNNTHFLFASALMWGIACTCKFSVLPMAGLCGLHALTKNPNPGKKFTNGLIWASCFLIGAFALAPYLFINADKMFDGSLRLLQQYFGANSVSTISFQRSDLLLPKYLLGYFGAAFWLAILLSVLHTDRSLNKLSIVLLAISFFYILVFSLLSFFNESNLSHLAFIWCLLLAIAVEACIARAQKKTKYIKLFFIIITTAILATPALCSFKIRNEVYPASVAHTVEESVLLFEQKLKKDHPGTTIVDISKHPELLQSGIASVIVKMPWVERNEYNQFQHILLDKHYLQISEIKLPLNDLPHSQLQTIHFPASYRYYQLKNID